MESENIRQLIEHQQTLEKSFTHFDNSRYVTTNLNFWSDLVGKDKKNKDATKRNLTKYAFEYLHQDKNSFQGVVHGATRIWNCVSMASLY
jgi:hypothetical protein